MFRGSGFIQKYLRGLILKSPDPLTFDEILACAYPVGSFEGDMAKTLGGSNVGRVRSLRRALRRLCDDGGIMRIGEGGRGDPYRYWLNPMMVVALGDKEFFEKVCERIDADPAMSAAADACAKQLFRNEPPIDWDAVLSEISGGLR